MVHDSVLRVKHLPKELSNEEKEEFLQHFGATEVKIVNYPREKVIAFAKFENAEVAKAVLFRLHQLVVLNSRLSVDYAEHDIGDKQPKLKKVEDDSLQKKCFKNFIVKLHSFNNSAGFHQPPPPHLRYEYPKANRPTINNIAHVLATVPKFYIQVLHLMNRMNLPPPFVLETVPTPPIKPHLNVIPQKQIAQTPVTQNNKSSSESEIESDNELNTKDIIPQKQNLSQRRPIKRPKFIKPNAKQVVSSKIMKSEEVFDKVNMLSQRHIELKVPSEILERLESVEKESIVEEHIMAKEVSKEKIGTVIGDEDLKSNQIPLKDLGVFPIFKDYHPGIPSNRLYIKNIAKNVRIEDLEHIFNRYKIEPSESKQTQFDIRLMQEGRMKGQAFVTLDSMQTAQKAVKETNGFILKDKPLVVMFARSSAQKPNS